MGRDELGEGGNVNLFFLRSGDDNVRVWGVSSSVTSKFEVGLWCFVLIRGSVKRSPMTSVLCPFIVKDAESVSDGCWSFDYKFVLLYVGTSPLQAFEVEVNWNQDCWVIWVGNIVSSPKGSVFAPICFFKISFGDVAFSPSVLVSEGSGSQSEV